MDILLIINLLSALFTVIFAIYTCFHVFHRHSMQHRVEKIKTRMMPLIIGKVPKKQIIDKLKKEGFTSEEELDELYEKFNLEYSQRKNP